MNAFEATLTIAQVTLRMRVGDSNLMRGSFTYDDIDAAVDDAAKLTMAGDKTVLQVVFELRRCYSNPRKAA